jgi:chromosome partitioning protein
MKEIAFVSKKGGVGKTTLLLLVRMALRQAAMKVDVRDFDPQGSVSKALRLEESADVVEPPYHFLLIDTPPNLSSPATDAAAREAHIILVPCSPSPLDLWEAQESTTFARSRNPHAHIFIVVNRAKSNTLLTNQARTNLGLVKFPILPVQLSERQCYQRAIIEGWFALDAAAREELLQLTVAITNIQ